MTLELKLSHQSYPVNVKIEDLDFEDATAGAKILSCITLRQIVPSQVILWEAIGNLSLQGAMIDPDQTGYRIKIEQTEELRIAEGVNLTNMKILYWKYPDSMAKISIRGGLDVGSSSMQITGSFRADSEWDLETDCYGLDWDFELQQMIHTFLNEAQSLKLRLLIQKGQLDTINYRFKLTCPILYCYINLLIGEEIQNQILQLRLSMHRETREVRLTIPSDEDRELLSQILNRGTEYPRDICLFDLDVEPGGHN
jgi:hypothetical protein